MLWCVVRGSQKKGMKVKSTKRQRDKERAYGGAGEEELDRRLDLGGDRDHGVALENADGVVEEEPRQQRRPSKEGLERHLSEGHQGDLIHKRQQNGAVGRLVG